MIIVMGRVAPESTHIRAFVQQTLDVPTLAKWASAALVHNTVLGHKVMVAWCTTPLAADQPNLGWAVVDLGPDEKIALEWSAPGMDPPYPYIVKRDEVLAQLEKAMSVLKESEVWQSLSEDAKNVLKIG